MTKGADYTHNNYSAAVVQVPVRVDGRVALARKGFLRRAEEAAVPEVDAGSEELRRKFPGPTAGSVASDASHQAVPSERCWVSSPFRGASNTPAMPWLPLPQRNGKSGAPPAGRLLIVQPRRMGALAADASFHAKGDAPWPD